MGDDHSRIGLTAHYTSYVWYRAGMSHRGLVSPLGRAMHIALRPINEAYARFSDRPNLDMMLLARHRVLDHLLEREIAAGRVGQVVEMAAGLSPRGVTFARRHRDAGLRYVEGDLPAMAAAKRRRLQRAGLAADDHLVVPLDALAEEGPASLAAVAREHLDPARGLAVVTEGLVAYLDRKDLEALWGRVARVLSGFPSGIYLSDLNLAGDLGGMRAAVAFRGLLELVTRGRVYLHYRDETEAVAALRQAGFAEVAVRLPGSFPEVDVPGRERRHVVRLIAARTRS